jgi:hypothetical protein
MAYQNSPKIVTDGLVLCLDAGNSKSYPGTGTTWTDLTTNKYNITLNSTPVLNSANGGSLTFNGSISGTASSALGSMGTGNWTISYWWKSNGSQANYVSVLGQGFTGSPSNGAWAAKISHTSNILNFTYYNNGIVDNLSSTNPNDSIWHNIVITRTSTNLIMYMDLIVVLNITLPTNYSFGTGATTNIGYNPRDNSYINGFMSIISFYNTALSTVNILQNYNAIKSRFGL